MTSVEIYNSPRYSVISYGRGWAYSAQRRSDGATLWLQDDDAAEFGLIFDQSRDFDDAIADYDEIFEVR